MLMKRDPDAILSSLKSAGCRMTRTRKSLVEYLCIHEAPISVVEILAYLAKKSLPINKTTAYREISALMERGVVREIDLLDGLKRYELLDAENHHHHLVCKKCKKVKCVEMQHDLDVIERRIARSHNFVVQSHVLEFFGLCQRCAG